MISTDPSFWQTILAQLEAQGRDTFNQLRLKEAHVISQGQGLLVIGVPSATAQDWLQNRLYAFVSRLVTRTLGREMALEFRVAAPEPEVLPQAPAQIRESQEPSPTHLVAQADHYAALFGKGSAGYSRLARHTTGFVAPLIGGDPFLLWKSLEADDKRPLDDPANWWSPPASCSFDELAGRIGKRTGGCISGKEAECDRKNGSRKKRNSSPVTCQEECCAYIDADPPAYPLLRLKPHGENGFMCQHWAAGHLETLLRAGLAVAELKTPTSYKPLIQVWRMPSLLTPFQHRFLPPSLQEEYSDWIEDYGPLFGLANLRAWQRITESSLWPLLPGYAGHQIANNYLKTRDPWRTFLTEAFRNPTFTPVEPDCNYSLYLFQADALAEFSGMHDSNLTESEADHA